MNRKVDWRELNFEVELLDIQELNDGLFAGRFEVAKTSFHAALSLADRFVVLPSGSALGFGVGPLLLAARAETEPSEADQLTLCPGEQTTAALLFQLFYPATTRLEHTVFSDIMPRLQQKKADFGVCIHEGRFTWQQQGLFLVEDLGQRWEETTSCPLPLGGIVASRDLGEDRIARVQAVIRDSLEFALADPDAPLPTMRQHAQEFDDAVLRKHVELYVNDWTLELGEAGGDALRKLSEMAKQRQLITTDAAALEIFA